MPPGTDEYVAQWYIYDVATDALARVLNPAGDYQASELVETLTWDSPERKDSVAFIGPHLLSQGASYRSLTETQAEILDEWIWGLPSLESFGEALGVTGGAYIRWTTIKELEGILPHSKALSQLRYGERIGGGRPAHLEAYAILSPSEIAIFQAELEAVPLSGQLAEEVAELAEQVKFASANGRTLIAVADI